MSELVRPALNFGTQFWRWTDGKYYQMLGRVKSFTIGTSREKPEWLVQLTREDPEKNLELVSETYFLTKMELGTDHRLACSIYVMPIPEAYEPEKADPGSIWKEILNYNG